jgi:hypothetical protein
MLVQDLSHFLSMPRQAALTLHFSIRLGDKKKNNTAKKTFKTNTFLLKLLVHRHCVEFLFSQGNYSGILKNPKLEVAKNSEYQVFEV